MQLDNLTSIGIIELNSPEYKSRSRLDRLESSLKHIEGLLWKNKARAPPKEQKEENIPRILYHGTCCNYFYENLLRKGEYRHNNIGDNVWLDNSPATSASYAITRARTYHDQPLLIITDTKKLEYKINYSGQWKVKALPIGSFEVYQPFEFIFDPKCKFSEKNLKKIKEHEVFLLTNNEQELKRSYFRGVRSLLNYLE